jgi:hypothetical protein
LPLGILREACDQLGEHDATIGPSVDGGYYLLGLRRPCARLFEEMPWSTSRVYGETLRRARETGISICTLGEWYDVDVAEDLTRLEDDLRLQPPEVAVHTREVMQRVRLQAAG